MLKGEVLVMIGDKVPLILMTLETHPMEEHADAIPWIPYHPTLWISWEILWMHSVMLVCKLTLVTGEGISKPCIGHAHGGYPSRP